MAIREDQRGALVRFSLKQSPDRVGIIATHRHARDVNRAVADGLHREILLAGLFATGGKLRNRPTRCGFGHLPARVRVHFSIQYHHVDVHSGAEHVIESAKPDVIGPSVAAHEPNALAHQRIGNRHQVARVAGFETCNSPLDFGDPLALRRNASLCRLISFQDLRDEAPAEVAGKAPDQLPRVVKPLVQGKPHPKPELGIVFEQGI
jgi:hypothetical protein